MKMLLPAIIRPRMPAKFLLSLLRIVPSPAGLRCRVSKESLYNSMDNATNRAPNRPVEPTTALELAAAFEVVAAPAAVAVGVVRPAEVATAVRAALVTVTFEAVELVTLENAVVVELKAVLVEEMVETCERRTVVVTGPVPVMTKGKEYWKMVGSESSWSFRPKAGNALMFPGIDQTKKPVVLWTPDAMVGPTWRVRFEVPSSRTSEMGPAGVEGVQVMLVVEPAVKA